MLKFSESQMKNAGFKPDITQKMRYFFKKCFNSYKDRILGKLLAIQADKNIKDIIPPINENFTGKLKRGKTSVAPKKQSTIGPQKSIKKISMQKFKTQAIK
jgi:hypothetical protein